MKVNTIEEVQSLVGEKRGEGREGQKRCRWDTQVHAQGKDMSGDDDFH